MALILGIETATKNCSVALFKEGILIAKREHLSDKYSHAEQLTIFIQEVLEVAKKSLSDLSAIALSQGPGSYTGLRIGTSAAKGLCYALNIPLIAVSTLQAMAYSMAKKEQSLLYCPMIDARRMEVFSAIYDFNNKEIRGVQADIVDEQTYASYLESGKVLFFGDGALKCETIIGSDNAEFIEDVYPSAEDLGIIANNKFNKQDFEDAAYFEPYYLKDFVAGKKKA